MKVTEYTLADIIQAFHEQAGNLNLDDPAVNQLVQAMDECFNVMQRVDADLQRADAEMKPDDVTQIGDYALTLLQELSILAANTGLQAEMLAIQALSLPVTLWIAKHGGSFHQLETVVNAVANEANISQDTDELTDFALKLEPLMQAVDENIQQDVDNANPMRPWKILNINWGIVATRSHNPEVMRRVFDQLIKNIPEDARAFFAEGMKQMDIVGYPEHVREVMAEYSRDWGVDAPVH